MYQRHSKVQSEIIRFGENPLLGALFGELPVNMIILLFKVHLNCQGTFGTLLSFHAVEDFLHNNYVDNDPHFELENRAA